ncbi:MULTISPECIES: GGDEF domain-containing protein [unclassified Brevundimonas]|uniref:GGDEF domain-containing protein n=1 Tax=unclassified Brevundimonas TaxID=2622653 RepID=UPI0025BB5EFF|nr:MULTISPECIES: GGDEF domain-containing protein [unclassified Brevundimonas]
MSSIAPVSSARVEQLLREVSERHAGELADRFYDVLLTEEEAGAFLNSSLVEERLKASLVRWVIDLFRQNDANRDTFRDQQHKIGEVHARIKLPLRLVMHGATVLKLRLAERILEQDLDRTDLAAALMRIDYLIDEAIAIMSEAYMQGSVRRAQVDESYRLFALGQDIAHERDGQIAALFEWLQGVLFQMFAGHAVTPGLLASSPFGLWLTHRAGLIFEGAPSLKAIEALISRIDADILPRITSAHDRGQDMNAALVELQAAVQEIKFLITDLFQSVSGLENGRDPLTRALNRRFLPTILSREISLSTNAGAPLSLMMLDVDHFKSINDTHGHSAGDLVLKQVAEIIADNVRLSDFVFRYGGEEFLIVLVETALDDAEVVAERIRQQLAARDMRLPAGDTLRVTASLGLAAYTDHPDYNQLIETADAALYRAKNSGRNRTVIAA